MYAAQPGQRYPAINTSADNFSIKDDTEIFEKSTLGQACRPLCMNTRMDEALLRPFRYGALFATSGSEMEFSPSRRARRAVKSFAGVPFISVGPPMVERLSAFICSLVGILIPVRVV
jgi:hypothetical protein